MPSKVRIEYAGARYHVINRGNYRGDVFATPGASESFLRALAQAAERYTWKVHAYALMRNHYHLAIETTQPNLSVGMHWLQSTFACRFNRFRKENGRLFQGPYKALLIEGAEALRRVVDYIHLNPVRAKVVEPAQVGQYEWSSLKAFKAKTKRAAWLRAGEWLCARGEWADTPDDMAAYEKYLVKLGNDEAAQKAAGLENLSRGLAIGTDSWKQAVARDYAQRMKMSGMGLEKHEVEQIRAAHNENALAQALKEAGRTEAEMQTKPRRQGWKIKMALEMSEKGVPVEWLAKRLHLGKGTTARNILYLARREPP